MEETRSKLRYVRFGPFEVDLQTVPRPLPGPRINAHRQITNDGRFKQLIGTDGNRFYFNQGLGTIWQVSISGGESAQIPIPLDHVTAMVDTSLDGSNLLILAHQKGFHPDGQLWVVPIFGGAIHRLPAGGVNSLPTETP